MEPMGSADHAAALIASIKLSSIATVITNPRLTDNPIVAINRAFEQLTGHATDEVLGRNCRLLRGPGTDPSASKVLRTAIADARPVMAEILNYRKDGTPFRNAVMIAPIFDDEGQLAFFIGSQMEVEGRAEAADVRREEARRQLERLSRRQREVLQLMAQGMLNKQIAHELGISDKTVKMHRAALLLSLNARASADAIRLAVEAGL